MVRKENTEILKENQTIEFKSSWRDDNQKTLCAFANSHGGKLILGVDDSGNPIGLTKSEKLMEDIPSKCNEKMGIFPKVSLKKKAKQELIEVDIEKQEAPISYNGKYYVRSGSTTLELSGSSLTQFLMSKTRAHWDEVIEPNATIDDIDPDTVSKFQELAKVRAPFISKEKDLTTILKKLNLIQSGKLKRAAILLFGKNPKKFYSSANIRIGKFSSPTDLLTTDDIEGNLFYQIDRCLELFFSKYIVLKVTGYEGAIRKEEYEYPMDAIREAVINAILHKDYTGVHSQFKVQDNKITMWNPGALFGGQTIDELKLEHISVPRNKLIADTFFIANLIESWGRGISKILKSCKSHGLLEPSFAEKANGFSITIVKDRMNEDSLKELGLNDRQIRIILELKSLPDFSASDVKKLFSDVSDITLRRDLSNLVQKGLLEAKGTTKNRTYTLKI
ncbi:MAG: putative DNA binding domain-containing protein [Candidatus Margulisbacteria bacterium]|nr:putative DNA binding domain-containing protein [Candidatus Margulisiibacteriota bacterium]